MVKFPGLSAIFRKAIVARKSLTRKGIESMTSDEIQELVAQYKAGYS